MRVTAILFVVFLLAGCKKSSGPTTITLIRPLKNELCSSGEILSATERIVDFEWAGPVGRYQLSLKNLETGLVTAHTSEQVHISLPLPRGRAYSWSVSAIAGQSADTVKSEIWKFFNAGIGEQSYLPYPADLIFPVMGGMPYLRSGTVSLRWEGADPDNDIVSYAVYFGAAAKPGLLKDQIKEMFLNDIPVINNEVYYWQVTTKDSKGHISYSEVYNFRAYY